MVCRIFRGGGREAELFIVFFAVFVVNFVGEICRPSSASPPVFCDLNYLNRFDSLDFTASPNNVPFKFHGFRKKNLNKIQFVGESRNTGAEGDAAPSTGEGM